MTDRAADRSWVTQADLEIEQMLRERIAARYPAHGVMGEEQGVGDVGRELRRRIKKAFDANGIRVPTPQMQVTVKDTRS